MSEINKRIITSIILLLVLIFSFNFDFIFIILLIIINFLVLLEFSLIFKKIYRSKKFQYFLSMIFTLIYMITFSLFIWNSLIQEDEYHKFSLIFLITLCSATDIGGFIFGKLIGGKKFSTISPNKTYSGVVGSFLLPLIIGFIFYKIFKEFMSFDLNIVILIIAISFISQCGDLFISFIKRKAKIKDTGNILPGHGGILDRIDGILLALPFGMFIMF
jgi:phosphatidate cytidylyltransferase